MGLYATLESGTVQCPSCGESCTGEWEFHFGAVSSLPRYRIGDAVQWSGSQWFGAPSMSIVHAVAYSVREPACSRCGTACIIAELMIRSGVLEGLTNPKAESYAPEGAGET